MRGRSRWVWMVLAGAVVVLLAVALRPGEAPRLPDLALVTLDGDAVQMSALQGRPLMINLWATWCEPCRREMPVLRAAQRRHDDVRVAFVNTGEDAAVVRTWLTVEEPGLANVWLDPERLLLDHFGAAVLPSTLFFDADGALIALHRGELTAAALSGYLERLRAPPPRGSAPPRGS